MSEPIKQPELTAEVAAKLRAVEIAQLAALRDDIRALSNVMALLLNAVSPQDARFLDKAQALEAQVGKTHAQGLLGALDGRESTNHTPK